VLAVLRAGAGAGVGVISEDVVSTVSSAGDWKAAKGTAGGSDEKGVKGVEDEGVLELVEVSLEVWKALNVPKAAVLLVASKVEAEELLLLKLLKVKEAQEESC